MAQKIEIVRGTSNTFQINIADATSRPYVTASGERVIFGIKEKATDTDLLLTKEATVQGTGIYNVKFSPKDTAEMSCGRYYYDVSLQSGEDFFNVITPSPFVIQPEVTRWGCMG